MTIFRFKKQIQKLFLFSAIILILFSIFPVLNKAEAQVRGPSCIVNSNLTQATVATDRTNVKWDEPFNVQVVLAFKDTPEAQAAAEACKATPDRYSFQAYLYQRQSSYSSAFQPGVNIKGHFYSPGQNGATEYGIAARQEISVKALGMLDPLETYGFLYVYVWDNDTNQYQNFYFPADGISFPRISTNPVNESPTPLQPLPAGIQPNSSSANNDPNAVKKVEDVKMKFTSGLRDKYRVLYAETSPYNRMVFDGSNGVEKINMDWADASNIITTSNQLLVPDKNYSILSNPYFRNIVVGLNFASTEITDKGCISNTLTEDCSGIIFSNNGINDGNGLESAPQSSLPAGFNPTLNNAAWAKPEFRDKTVAAGQPLGSVEFRAIPILWASRGLVINNDWFAYVYGSKAAKFTVEVYKTEADIKLACENDAAVTDKSICSDPQKMRYQVGSVVQATTGTDQKSGGQTLYGFIIRVISAIVIFLTSQIYKIFAFFVVPVLNALLNVKPYQDAFVNIIYPGWLILRNLANIFFIIALLWVGLKILFQRAAASTAQSFIVRLILMALLVNFSLVIAQGVVGIADTVQSQFLPANSRVIEALGTKLMVEPIVSFRTAVDMNGDTSGPLTGDQPITDIAKPIVLLMLAVAAFFCFLAIAAFLAIRLVGLMLLYMVSPVAYMTYVFDEGRSYMSRWWSEFLKYAFFTPILVFFLNMAALVATAFQSQNGDVIRIDDTLAGDLVTGGLTIVSHFIVLIVLIGGMKMALGFSAASSKKATQKISDWAEKGFKNTFKKPAEWAGMAKDWGVDKAASYAEKKDKPGFAKAITAVSKPVDFAKSLKKAQLTNPKEEREKREKKRLESLAGIKEKGSPLKKYWDGIKEKGLGDEDSASLQDMLVKNSKDHETQKAGEALLQMGKNGNFDEILDAAHQVTDKDYSKDAAGLNAAVKDLGKSAGISEKEQTEFMKSFDQAAKKQKDKSHYTGNTYRDGDKVKVFDVEQSPDGGYRFTGDDHGKWVQKQVDRRLGLEGGIVDDIRQTGLDSMVYEAGEDDAGNKTYGMTETQLAMFSQIDLNSLTPHAIDRFKSSSPKKLAALRDAWNRTGRNELEEKLINEGVGAPDAAARVEQINKLFVTQDDQNGQNNNQQNTRNAAGFTARPIVVQGGGTINPGGGTAFSGQSAQMDAAQNINNTVKFEKGPAGGPVGDIGSLNNSSNKPASVGYADTNVGKPENLKESFVDKPKSEGIGFVSPNKTEPKVKEAPKIIHAPESKSSPTYKPKPTVETPPNLPVSPEDNQASSAPKEDTNKDQK